jgi:TonB-linked SusC/RagA family outer membrane protein
LVENKQATAFNSFFERKNWMVENTATYNTKFNKKHHLKLLIGQSYQTEDINTTGSSPLAAQIVDVDGVKTTTFPKFEEKWSLLSYISRLNYDYKDKYIFSGSIRRDGSSRFGVNTKWGWFPAVSAAWVINNESYFKSKTINELKARISWGITGNNGSPNYGAISLLDDANYGETAGLAAATSPNQNLSWEQTSTLDTGLDISFFNGKISFTADYYKAITDGLLLDVPVPAHSGYNTSLRNIGKVQNTGFEVALNINKAKLGYIKWNSTLTFSTNKNEVLELGPDQDRILTDFHITQVGQPIGSFYTYRKIGVFQTQEQINTAPLHPEMRLGDYIFADLNGDNKITQDDREISGNFFPDFTYGFSNTFKYYNLTFSFLLQGKQGYEIFNGNSFFIRNLEGWSNGHSDINDYYSDSNLDAAYASPGKHVKTYEKSDLFVEDGSYIRLRKISIKYSIPQKLIKRMFIDKLAIYAAATNLFTITNYTGFNPEVSSNNSSFNNQKITPGFDYGAYPVAKTIVLGLNLTF